MVVTICALGFIGMFSGLLGVLHSDLFLLRVVEFEDFPEHPLLSEQEALEIAQVPKDTVNLFSLRLDGIENRLVQHPWIQSVELVKRFPQTLSIRVSLREPVFVVRNSESGLQYVDDTGYEFAAYSPKVQTQYPLLEMSQAEDYLKIVEWHSRYLAHPVSNSLKLLQVRSDAERGLKIWVSYQKNRDRTSIDLGPVDQAAQDSRSLDRLVRVIEYLKANSLNPKTIVAGLGKKIVVRKKTHF